MPDSALAKVDSAAKHVTQLSELLREKRPFRYVFETNEKTGECALYAERDVAIVEEVADLSYSVVQRLRTALDYAYWEIVSPFAVTEKERRAVQFPFSQAAARLDEAVKNRLANRVSEAFFNAIIGLRPYGEPGGNELLYAIHDLAADDRHRYPTPIGEYKRVPMDVIRRQVPSFPRGIVLNGLGGFGKDVVWHIKPLPFLDGGFIFKREIDVPVDVVLQIGAPQNLHQMVPALNAMVDKTKEAIQIIRSA
jgi:hypothetical protein